MKNITSDFKNNIGAFGRELDSKITYTINNEDIELGKSQLNSVSLHYESDILKSVMKQLDVDSNVDIPIGTEINYQFGVKTRSGKNLFDKDNANIINGYVAAGNHQIIAIADGYIVYVPCKSNTTYTIQKLVQATSGNNAFRVGTSSTIPATNTILNDFVRNDTASSITLTTGSNANYLSVYCYNQNNENTWQEMLNSIQIEQGNQATSYEEYGQYEYINGGNYIVYSSEKQEDTRSYKIVCYDKMLYSMKDYESLEIAYPITIRSYISAICTKLGLTFKNASDVFANYDKEIPNELYLDSEGADLGYTFRDVLDELAQVTASIICINEEDDSLEIRYITDTQSRNLFAFGDYVAKSDGVEIISKTQDELVATVSSASTWKTISYDINGLETNTNYTFKFNFENTYNSELYQHTWLTIKNSGGTNLSNGAYYKNDTITFNTGNSQKIRFVFHITINSPAVINTITINQVQLEKGSTSTPYEKFGLDEINEKYLKDINVNFGEKYGPINSIVLSRSAESDNVYLQDEESIEENGLCEIKIKDNQIMNFNDRSDYLEDILEKLDGLEYYINDFSSTGIAYYELGDRYNISIDNNTYTCVMFNDEINITQGLEENVHTELPEDSETDYKKADKTDRRINQTYIIADKQKGQIEALTSRTTTLENETSNMYTIEQVNTLIQNAETGVTNTFSEAGGNNIFRNTGLWFEDTSNRDLIYPSLDLYPSSDLFSGKKPVYDFWTGDVEKIKEDNAVNLSALLLKNNSLGQEQFVSNGTYTISFKYKKLIELANVTCTINDVQYELTETTDTEFEETIEVNSQYINIIFTSDTDDACEIYDLMVNAGSVKLAYSQNQNETTTDTVNISKGITITSSDTDTTFKANSDGIRIYGGKDLTNPKTKFTDKGTQTDYLEAKEEAIVVDILIQRVGSHTWLTKI